MQVVPATAAGAKVDVDKRLPQHAVRATACIVPYAVSKRDMLGAALNWVTWGFIVFLVSAQLLSIVWGSTSFPQHLVFGQDPRLGPFAITGFNDEPYTDRVLACVEDGRYYRATQLTDLLASKGTKAVDTTGVSVNAYRIVEREGLVIDANVMKDYTNTCTLIAATMDAINNVCEALGYNITKDSLRVLNGVRSNTTYLIPHTLPILVMPFWDNAPVARYAVPSFDGAACMFRLTNKYTDPEDQTAFFRGVNRTARERMTSDFLRRLGGVWRNGWYEDQTGEKWSSDMMSIASDSVYGLPMRQFDMLKNEEKSCVSADECKSDIIVDHWGSKFTTKVTPLSVDSFAVSNGARFGLFLYEHRVIRVVSSTYDWETMLSNISIVMLLLRWFEAMYALQYGYARGLSRWHNAGIGCLANLRSFNLLPIMLLPKLKVTLAAFWTLGCEVEGQQKALSDAWFVVYPAIVELVLLYFSLLNTAAKLLRRRVTDVLFGPTVLFYCLLHRYRTEIAQLGWFGIDGRVPALIVSNEVDRLSVLDFFTTSAPFRMNGNVTSLIAVKLAVLGLNLLPLLFTRSAAVSEQVLRTLPRLGIERALAVRCCNLGGLGRSAVFEYAANDKPPSGRIALNSYELVRLGYVVYGDRFLISIDHWEVVSTLAAFKGVYNLWNHRVAVFALEDEFDGESIRRSWEMRRLDDPELLAIPWRLMFARPIK